MANNIIQAGKTFQNSNAASRRSSQQHNTPNNQIAKNVGDLY